MPKLNPRQLNSLDPIPNGVECTTQSQDDNSNKLANTQYVETALKNKVLKNNLTNSSPTITDDSSVGYSVNSRWFNSITNKLYICKNASIGAAIWTEIMGDGGGTIQNLSWNATTSTVDISGGGTSATLTEASAINKGLLTTTLYNKLTAIDDTVTNKIGNIGTKQVDESALANNKILKYNSTSGKYEAVDQSGGGGGTWGSITGTLSDQTDLQNALNAFDTIIIDTKTANYTLQITDKNKMIDFNSSSATTLSIPEDAVVSFPIGTVIVICQSGTGQVSVLGLTNVNVYSVNSNLFLAGQYCNAIITKMSTNTWYLTGDVGL